MSHAETVLRDALEEARKTIKKQDDVLQQLLEGPTSQGFVVARRGSKVLVSVPSQGLMEVAFPYNAIDGKDISAQVKSGALVRMLMEPPAILDVLDYNDVTGDIVLVVKEGDKECTVDMGGTERIVRTGELIKAPEVGDRLMLDADSHVAIRNLGPDESKFNLEGGTGVTWDDIGGLFEAKQTLKEAIELPLTHPELYKLYGKHQTKGVLLSGPPGVGKTMLGKATATALANLHKKESVATGFIYVKGPELLDKYVGNSEAQIRSLFARARKHQKKHGYPALVFIDEGDALLGKRDGRLGMGIEATTVPQFLSEMDGLDATGPIVLVATNRPDSLDSAVTRDGRIDQKVHITRPDRKSVEDIFKLYLKKTALSSNESIEAMAMYAADRLFDEQYRLYEIVPESGTTVQFTLSGLVNGAMVAGMVDKATTIAMRRDIENKNFSKPTGITTDDLKKAADQVYMQNLHTNHEVEMKEFVEANRLTVSQILKSQHAVQL